MEIGGQLKERETCTLGLLKGSAALTVNVWSRDLSYVKYKLIQPEKYEKRFHRKIY